MPQVYNPPPSAKKHGREILKLASNDFRRRQYESWAAKWGYEVAFPRVAHACIPLAMLPAGTANTNSTSSVLPSYCPQPLQRA